MNFDEYFNELVALRREFHQIPEICYKEEKTSKLICEKLEEFGIKNFKRIFNTGVVAVIGSGENCIGLRMDIDALPVIEKNDIPYKSKIDGMMHACGHDGHIAILLMTAKILKKYEKDLKSSVKIIFQPAEEGSGGALPMIEEGVLENPTVTKIFGMHLWPDVPVSKAEFVNGTAFAGSDRYEILVKGKGGHGAMPKGVINSLIPASQIILELDNLQKEEKESVISACNINAKGFHNIFPDNTEIMGTIRTLREDDRKRIMEKISAICENVGEKNNVEVCFMPVFEYPPCVNDKETLNELIVASQKAIGQDNVIEGETTYGAEDFSYFSLHTKAAHIRVGTNNKEDEKTQYPLHNPNFNIDETALLVGLKIFVETALSM